jgi:potassium-dependent mechanosensitive channel
MIIAVLVLSLLALPALSRAPATAAPAAPATPSASTAAPKSVAAPLAKTLALESIPVPEIARRAEEVAKLLRDIDRLVVPDYLTESIEKRLPDIASRIAKEREDTDHQLGGGASGAALDGLTAQWQATRAEISGYVKVLADRATVLEGAMTRLTTVHEIWTRTRADARASRAPAQVIERIDGVLSAVAAARTRVQEQRAATLVSQDRFAQEVARSEDALERITKLRQEIAGRVLEQDSVPLWYPQDLAAAAAELPDSVRNAITADVALLRQFVQNQRWKIPLQVALFIALLLVIRAARRRPRSGAVTEGAVAGVALHVFDRSVSAALVLTLLASSWIYSPPLPRAFVALAEVLALGPALRLMQVLLDPSLGPALYLLGAFFLADLVRHLASVVPMLERQIFLIEMLAGVAVLSWWVSRRSRWARAGSPATGAQRVLTIAARVVLVAFSAALVAGIAGYMKLALLLGGRILGNGYLALVLYAGVGVGDGLVAFALRARPLRYLGMVQRWHPLLERRAHSLLRGLAIAGWVILSLQYFGLWPAAVALTQSALGAEMRRGTLSVSLGDVMVFAVTVAAAFLVSAIVRFTLEEEVYPRLRLGRGLPNALSSLLHYTLLLAGFLLALAALGVDLTKITILAGAFGVGIGFGLQNVVNNFVSGAIVLFERKINVGDAVQIGDVAGQVQQMGMRACTVRTWEGAEVIVPNASLTADKVTNWTLSDRLRRIDVAVRVAYGTAPGKALDVLLGVARAHPQVLTKPEAEVLFRAFGDSALLFEMRVWTDRFDLWMKIQSELTGSVYEALREAGIEIPFPQHEVRLRQS